MHNSRSELTSATANGATYGYAYDNIGNRTAALEESSGVASRTAYTANELNQYTSIQENEEAAFVPTFDANGNQTLVKTSTGIWSVQYNAENRPVRFTNADGAIVIECCYDTHGRRATKKVISNGIVILHQRYIYRGYLQIACCDLTRSNHPALWYITWDPTQSMTTRPLAIRKDGTWYAYGWDKSKNICEVFGPNGYIRTSYVYSPYGEVKVEGDVTQHIQWASEYYDSELALIYYNYRYYNNNSGKWGSRDISKIRFRFSEYDFVANSPMNTLDLLGAIITPDSGHNYVEDLIEDLIDVDNQEYTANPKDGYKACEKYTQLKSSPCVRNGKIENDIYPTEAKKACDGFIDMYTKGRKLRNAVLCVAQCLTEAEKTNGSHICCEKRNAMRLVSHVSCYMKCGFIMDLFTKENRGVPENGWDIGATLLIPDALNYFSDSESVRETGKSYDRAIETSPSNVKYTNPLLF